MVFAIGNICEFVVTEYGQCPNTDTLGISETINPTKKRINEYKFIKI